MEQTQQERAAALAAVDAELQTWRGKRAEHDEAITDAMNRLAATRATYDELLFQHAGGDASAVPKIATCEETMAALQREKSRAEATLPPIDRKLAELEAQRVRIQKSEQFAILKGLAAKRLRAAQDLQRCTTELRAAVDAYLESMRAVHAYSQEHELIARNFAAPLGMQRALDAFLAWQLGVLGGLNLNQVVARQIHLEDFVEHETQLLAGLGLVDNPPADAATPAAQPAAAA